MKIYLKLGKHYSSEGGSAKDNAQRHSLLCWLETTHILGAKIFPGSFFPFCCVSGMAGCWSWWQIGRALKGTEQEQAARLKSRGQKRGTHAKAERIREPAVEGQVEQGKPWDSAAKSLEAGAPHWGSDCLCRCKCHRKKEFKK